MTVVGEIGDIKQKSADSDVTEQIYQPMSQFKVGLGQFAPPDMLDGAGGSIALRSSLPPEQMEELAARRGPLHRSAAPAHAR